jgi:hypothetical protein
MATTSIINYLETTGKSVTTGADVQLGTSPLNRIQTETFLTETAITKGQLVAVDSAKMATDTSGGLTALTVITADFDSAPVRKIVVGVAAEAVTGTATSPQLIKVVVRGPAAYVAKVDAGGAGVGVAIGDPLILDLAGGAGLAQLNTAANTLHVVGYGLSVVAAAGGNGVMYVLGTGI